MLLLLREAAAIELKANFGLPLCAARRFEVRGASSCRANTRRSARARARIGATAWRSPLAAASLAARLLRLRVGSTKRRCVTCSFESRTRHCD